MDSFISEVNSLTNNSHQNSNSGYYQKPQPDKFTVSFSEKIIRSVILLNIKDAGIEDYDVNKIPVSELVNAVKNACKNINPNNIDINKIIMMAANEIAEGIIKLYKKQSLSKNNSPADLFKTLLNTDYYITKVFDNTNTKPIIDDIIDVKNNFKDNEMYQRIGNVLSNALNEKAIKHTDIDYIIQSCGLSNQKLNILNYIPSLNDKINQHISQTKNKQITQSYTQQIKFSKER